MKDDALALPPAGVRLPADNHVELYNVVKDMGERNDLARTMPDKAARLTAMLHEWRRSVNADMPTPNPKYDPAREMDGL